MKKYILKRLLISLATLWMLVTVSFFLLRALPGNPFQTEILVSEATQQRMIQYYGLNEPLMDQYILYMKNLLQGDMGYSIKYSNRTVNEIIAAAFPSSAELGLCSLALAVPLGLFMGIAASRSRGKAVDYLCVFIAVIGISVPSFTVGTLLQYAFGVKLHILPIALWKGLKYAVLPSVAMGLSLMASITRIMRASMLDVMTQDYIKTAKAKGLSQRQIIMRHQIRNAMLPIVTILGPMVASVLVGTFIIEQIFAIPGLGLYFVQSIQSLDYTVTLGLTIFFGFFLVTANFLVDIAYGLIDPRIRISS